MSVKSLHALNHDLADTEKQLEVLNGPIFSDQGLDNFQQKLEASNLYPLKPTQLEILQLNLGYMCNQTCKHCHVDAGPDRKEIMSKDVMAKCQRVILENNIKTVDLTGGAPEMNPNFRWFVKGLRDHGYKGEIIVRCNLTIILANPKYHDLPDFFKNNMVRVVSSLPFYNADKTDRQRGKGVFNKSIEALQKLNAVGYGQPESDLLLDLVYNPSGAFLPADQSQMEADFKKELIEHFGIEFNNLLSITNLPIARFLDYLVESDNLEDYLTELVLAYNPVAASGVMCRNTISVDYDGKFYDCDFNQMLKLPVKSKAKNIESFDLDQLLNRNIVINQHCFGCTAGAGSSCQGATS